MVAKKKNLVAKKKIWLLKKSIKQNMVAKKKIWLLKKNFGC
jgi:hypothetical protein